MNIMKKTKLLFLQKWRTLLKIAIAFIFLILIFFGGKEQIRHINIAETIHLMQTTSWIKLLFLYCVGGVAAATMTLYDFTMVYEFKYSINSCKLFCISFIANTLNNLLGLGGIVGITIRNHLLKKNQLNTKEIIHYQYFILPAIATGLSAMSILVLLGFKWTGSFIVQHHWLIIGLIVFSAYLILYFSLDKIMSLLRKKAKIMHSKQNLRVKMKLFCISFLEWGMAATLFCLIIFCFNQHLMVFCIIAIFTLGSIAGIMSFMPGGVGSFDLIALLGLQYYGISASNALAIILFYRIFYFILPVMTATTFLVVRLVFEKLTKSAQIYP